MTDDAPGDEHTWERGFAGHQKAQRRRFAALPLSAKLDWLEEAQRLAEHLRRGPTPPPPSPPPDAEPGSS